MRIVFFGTPRFARIILEYLLQQQIEVAAVICRPDKAQKRSKELVFPEVKQCALAHGLPFYQPLKASQPDFAAFLQTLNADFFVVAAYAEILKENLLAMPRYGCINVHGSLLPKYRGAAPVQRAIMAGESETGVTIIKMAPLVDAGEMLAIKKVPIPLEMTAGELLDVLADLGKMALFDVLKRTMQGDISPIVQDEGMVTTAKKITIEDAKINWDQDCLAVHNQIRAVTPNPGAWTWVEINHVRKRLRIYKSLPYPTHSGKAGAVCVHSPSELIVSCLEGAVRLLELQLEGKKKLTAEQFLRGTPADKIKFLST